MPVVSVILPCFNARLLIADAVQSIVAQTFQDWELIVVDDASTDGSADRIRAIKDPRIIILSQGTNQGYPAAMNAGIAKARGRFIARMDADDICLPTRLQEQLDALEQHKNASLCGINRFRITPGGKMYVDRRLPKEKYILETWDDLFHNRRLFTDPSVLLEKERIAAVGGYRTFQRSGMDVDLWLRVMERYGPCITITTPLFGKRLEPGSIIFNPNTFMLNQVPRVLARQRLDRGTDDEQEGKPIVLGDYVHRDWVVGGGELSKTNLVLGALVTCLWFRDWKGATIYARYLVGLSPGGLRVKVNLFMGVLKKLVQRARKNPYRRFTLSV